MVHHGDLAGAKPGRTVVPPVEPREDLSQGTVFIVDDDEAVRDSLSLLMESVALPARTFASAGQFLEAWDGIEPGVLILDVRMPGMSGLDLQRRLADRDVVLPIVFITGHGDVPMAVRAIQSGAVDFIQKPFGDQELLDRIHQALVEGVVERNEQTRRRAILQRLHNLSPREHEVMELVVQGMANKVIANVLSVSQRTVEIHRARVMDKMRAGSLAQLVQMAMELRAAG